jgi:acyl-CoA synthetase (AMP-forming)/AMP-acid ligase II
MIHTDLVRDIASLLRQHASVRPGRLAFTDSHRSVTYGELDDRTARLAVALLKLGLGTQDRFLMYLDNRVEVAEGYLAAPRAGVVTVCANPQATPAEVSYMAVNSDARIILTDGERLATVMALAEERTSITAIIVAGEFDHADFPGSTPVLAYEELLAQSDPTASPDSASIDDWCWMLYTSGTTGRPKGVHLTQRGCLWVVAACWAPIAGLNEDDEVLSVLPLFHSYALVLSVIGVAAVGAGATLLPKFSPQEVQRRMADDVVTLFPGVPTMFRYFLNFLDGSELDAPHLRLCVSAGALMPAALNTEFEDATGIPLLDGYGITETSTMVTMNSAEGSRVPGSCGLPLPGLSVRLVGMDGKDVPHGEEGELWVQGPNVMLGYHELPEATANVLQDGWYRTGDLAHRDENGFLIISGRLKELIIRGGENIYPAEIENVVIACDTVQDVAVIAAPHPDLGEIPIACVVATNRGGLDIEQIMAACRSQLSYFKIPAEVLEVAHIPRTGSGKVQRFHLQEAFRDSHATSTNGVPA